MQAHEVKRKEQQSDFSPANGITGHAPSAAAKAATPSVVAVMAPRKMRRPAVPSERLGTE